MDNEIVNKIATLSELRGELKAHIDLMGVFYDLNSTSHTLPLKSVCKIIEGKADIIAGKLKELE